MPTIILSWVAMVCNLKKLGPQKKSLRKTGLNRVAYNQIIAFQCPTVPSPRNTGVTTCSSLVNSTLIRLYEASHHMP